MASLDDLLRQQHSGPRAADFARIKAAALAETKSAPRASWRRDVRNLVLASWGMAFALTAILLATGNSSWGLISSRLPTVALLLAVGGVGSWVAIAPGSWRVRVVGVLLAMGGMSAIVVLRGNGQPASQPEWVCTVSHLALGLGPMAVALTALRRTAPNALRAVVAGLAVGTVGAMVGEVGCDQGWRHVLWFHLTPWLALGCASWLIARRLKRWSYAP